MIAAGRKSNSSATASCSATGSTFSVPNVSIMRETGWAVPMAYATWSWARSARPDATMFFATYRPM